MKTFKEYQDLVLKWSNDRNMFCPENGITELSQYCKFLEEFGELGKAINKNDRDGIKDAIGDCIISLINYCAVKKFKIRIHNKSLVNNNTKYSLLFLIKGISEVVFDERISIMYLILLEKHFGFEYLECLDFAYNEIKDRKGKMVNRTFVKESDLKTYVYFDFESPVPYLTKGKEYELLESDCIVNDGGRINEIRIISCSHLDYKPWKTIQK